MKYISRFFLLFVMSTAAVSFAGDIQVLCEPDLQVYLDDKLVGLSKQKQDGLFLANVGEGTHTIRIEKDGFEPRNYQVEVGSSPIEVRVEELEPVAVVRSGEESGTTRILESTASLVVTSAPQNCTVEIDGKVETKNIPEMTVGGLAAGEHRISFSKPGYDRISGVVELLPGAEVMVRGDLIAGRVETSHMGEGSLRVISTPERCAVRILGKTKQKTSGILNISHLPAGEHRLVVSRGGMKLSRKVAILGGHRTIVEVSFLKEEEPFVVSYEPEGRSGRRRK
jgi:hypothetical protein